MGSSGRFDWYSATITVNADAVIRMLSQELGALVQELDKSLNGYTNQAVLRRHGDVIARVLYGGNGGSPHAFASGDHAAEFAAVCRRLWPDHHRVSRCDVASDFDGPGTWDSLVKFASDFAASHEITTSVAGDWLTEGSPGGRTLYVGSQRSAVFLRIYEKGKEIRRRLLELKPEVATGHLSPDLVRVELVVRPEKESRYVAAKMDPMDGYGFAKWSHQFGSELFGLDVDRVSIKNVRVSDDERAMRYMVDQYGAVLERLVRDQFDGSWAALGAAMGKRVNDRATS